MTPNGILLALKAVLLCLSFTGLCAALRSIFRLDKFIAPFTALSSIITLLMLGGMLGVLKITLYALYALGFAGLVYVFMVRREKPRWGMLALMLVFIALLILRYYDCKFFRNDEISHWGLVARHLLRHDAFPDRNATHVFFQSYPLGAASFIYYVLKFTADIECIYIIAHNFILGALFLPVLSLIPDNKRAKHIAYPVAGLVFICLFNCFRFMQSLQVDLHLGFFGAGILACIARYRGNWKKAAFAIIPALLAVVYIKNSGMFFAVLGACMFAWMAVRSGMKKSRGLALGTGLSAASLLAYGAWVLHCKISFPAALDTKHAISLTTYARQMQEKGWETIMQIAKRFGFEMLRFSGTQMVAAAVMFGIGFVLLMGCLTIPSQKKHLKPVMLAYVFNVCIYLLWSFMTLLMYVFSMPTEEALRTASFYRYNGTGLVFLIAASCALLICWLSQEDVCNKKLISIVSACSSAVIVLFFCAAAVILGSGGSFNPLNLAEDVFGRHTYYLASRQKLMDAIENNVLETNGQYLAYTKNSGVAGAFDYYIVKYELESGNVHMIASDKYSADRYLIGTLVDNQTTEDYHPYLEETLSQCEAVIMLSKSETFEAEVRQMMAEQGLDLPLVYAY